jgi:hypothetical protein
LSAISKLVVFFLPILILLAGVLDDVRSMVVRGNYRTITSVLDMIVPSLGGEIGEKMIAKFALDSLTFGDFTEENGSVLRALLSTHCHLFWLDDLETGTGQHLPLADFIDSLLWCSERFAQDGDCYVCHCCTFPNIARLRDSAIGDVSRSVLMATISGRESLRQDGDAFVESLIRKVEGFEPKLCHRAPPTAPDCVNGFTAFTLHLGACHELDDFLCEFLLSALELLSCDYAQYRVALIESEMARMIVLVETF